MLEVFTKVAPRAYPNYARAFQNDAALLTRFKIKGLLPIEWVIFRNFGRDGGV
jgi:hypothetical protein